MVQIKHISIPKGQQLDIISNITPKHIFVIGDVILDQYQWGIVSRISPEAPVPIIKVEKEEYRLGGAANVAINIAALGMHVSLFSICGNDDSFNTIQKLCNGHEHVSTTFMLDDQRTTPLKSRFIAKTQQIVRIDKESKSCSPSALSELQNKILSEIDKADAVVLSDYQKGVLSKEIIHTLIATARNKNIPIIVDPKSADFSIYSGATIITPNKKEFSAASHQELHDIEAIAEASLDMRKTHNIDTILVTLGSQGMLLSSPDQTSHFPAHHHQVYDVTGAGDTVIASLAVALANKHNLQLATAFANSCAAISVTTLGTSAITTQQIHQFLATTSNPNQPTLFKIPELLEQLTSARSHGKKIVFTNGCFDIIHHGHIQLLQTAKQAGDILIVALNTDASIKRLKGKNRPFIPLEQRAQVIAALRSVDFVIAFDDDTPQKVITMIQPHILVKGGDYSIDHVVGRQTVEQHGGYVLLVPLIEGISTTTIAHQIALEQESSTI